MFGRDNGSSIVQKIKKGYRTKKKKELTKRELESKKFQTFCTIFGGRKNTIHSIPFLWNKIKIGAHETMHGACIHHRFQYVINY